MSLIKLCEIEHLLRRANLRKSRDLLRQLIDPSNHHQFEPQGLGIIICLILKSSYLDYHLYQLGFSSIELNLGSPGYEGLINTIKFLLAHRQSEAKGEIMTEADILFSVAWSGDYYWLEEVIKEGLLNPKTLIGPYGMTILHVLAQHGKLGYLIEFKEKYQLSWQVRDQNGATPLHYLMMSGEISAIMGVMRGDLENKPMHDLNQEPDKRRATYAHYLAFGGVEKCLITAMSNKWIDPTITDKQGHSLLHYLAWSGENKLHYLDCSKIKDPVPLELGLRNDVVQCKPIFTIKSPPPIQLTEEESVALATLQSLLEQNAPQQILPRSVFLELNVNQTTPPRFDTLDQVLQRYIRRFLPLKDQLVMGRLNKLWYRFGTAENILAAMRLSDPAKLLHALGKKQYELSFNHRNAIEKFFQELPSAVLEKLLRNQEINAMMNLSKNSEMITIAIIKSQENATMEAIQNSLVDREEEEAKVVSYYQYSKALSAHGMFSSNSEPDIDTVTPMEIDSDVEMEAEMPELV